MSKRILAAYILGTADQEPAHLLVHYNSDIGLSPLTIFTHNILPEALPKIFGSTYLI